LTCNPRLAWFVPGEAAAQTMTGRIDRSKQLLERIFLLISLLLTFLSVILVFSIFLVISLSS